jgi:hypothetical protein
MRRLIPFALACLVVAAALAPVSGCKRQRRGQVTTVEEETGPLVSMVNTADPRAAIQLVHGFHEIEHNAWRWTRGQFSVTLRVPDGGAAKGATLEVKLAVPDSVINHVKSTTLSAKIGAAVLDPATYSTSGEQTYTRDVPATELTGEAVSVDFSLDKFLESGVAEERELGIVVSSIGLIAK